MNAQETADLLASLKYRADGHQHVAEYNGCSLCVALADIESYGPVAPTRLVKLGEPER